MQRAEALEAIYPRLKDQVVVTIMGAVAVELYNLGHRPNFFYLEHGMGLASSMGLGLALSLPDQRVTVLDGDASLLMNLGTLSTMARYARQTSPTWSSTTRACYPSAASPPLLAPAPTSPA